VKPVHRDWPYIPRKEIRVETLQGSSLPLNRLKSRLNWKVLKELCIRLLSVHVYQSVLNYSNPWMVASALT
jgi:hypothetical protein